MNPFRMPLGKPALKFSEFIFESSDGANMAATGAAAELNFGSHLHEHIRHIIAKAQGKNPGEYKPQHMRAHTNKAGDTPEEAHKKVSAQLPKDHHAHVNDSCYYAAHASAHRILNHLKETQPDIHRKLMKGDVTHDVVWTAKPGDHKSYTGKDDDAHVGGADIMVGFKDKSGMVVHAHGESLKYQKGGPMKAATMGQDTVESNLGMKPGSLTSLQTKHEDEVSSAFKKEAERDPKFVEKHGTVNKTGQKVIDSRDHKKNAYRSLEAAAHPAADHILELQRRRDADGAGEIERHLKNMSHEDRHSSIINLVAPEHTYPTFHTTIHPGGACHSLDLRQALLSHLKGRETEVHRTNNRVHIRDKATGENVMTISHGDRRGYSTKLNLTAHIGDSLQKRLSS